MDLDAMPVVPPCIKNARKAASKEGLKLFLLWGKKKKISVIQILKTYLNATGLKLTADEQVNLLEEVENSSFSCELAKTLGFCEEDDCNLIRDPIQRLIQDTESVLWIKSTGELVLRISGVKKTLQLSKIYTVNYKGMSEINIKPIHSLYVSLYYDFPEGDITKEDIIRLLTSWKCQAEVISEPLDENSLIEQVVIDAFVSGRVLFYDLDDFRDGVANPRTAAFIKHGIIYIETNYLQNLLQSSGVPHDPNKLRVALNRITVKDSRGRSTCQLRGKDEAKRYRFWRFDLNAIRKLVKFESGIDWEPEIVNRCLACPTYTSSGEIFTSKNGETGETGESKSIEHVNTNTSELEREEHDEKPFKDSVDTSEPDIAKENHDDKSHPKKNQAKFGNHHKNPVEDRHPHEDTDSTESFNEEIIFDLSYLLNDHNQGDKQ